MRQIDARGGFRLAMVVWLVGMSGLVGCERGGGGEAPESEAEEPVAEKKKQAASEENDKAGAAAKNEKAGGAEKEKPAGDPLPELTARTVEGKSVTVTPESEATLVNLWATWCAPCIAELPEFQKLHDKWGEKGLRLVGLSIEGKKAEKKVAKFVDEREMPFDQVLFAPEQDPLKVLGAGAVPATFLYDADGNLVWWHGSMLEDPEIAQLNSHLDDLLGSGPN